MVRESGVSLAEAPPPAVAAAHAIDVAFCPFDLGIVLVLGRVEDAREHSVALVHGGAVENHLEETADVSVSDLGDGLAEDQLPQGSELS